MESFESRDKRIADLLLLPNKIVKNIDLNEDGKINGFQFDVGSPYHTAQPVDNIKKLLVSIDGEAIDPEKITLIVRDNRIKLLNIPTISEIWLAHGELLSVYVEKPGGLASGEHELECSMTVYPSFYLFMPVRTFPTKKIVTVK